MKDKLKEISTQIKALEKEQRDLITSVMVDSRKNIFTWAAILPLDEFKVSIKNLFAESYNKKHGTNHFAWNKTETIQDNFEWYMKRIMEGSCEVENKFDEDIEKYHKNLENDDKFFYYKPLNRFFNLKKSKSRCTTRSTHMTEKYSVNDKGQVVYSYSGTSYHGFGSVDNTVQQELILDMDNMRVVNYTDSTDKYSPRYCGHDINTDFIDGWVDFAKQNYTK